MTGLSIIVADTSYSGATVGYSLPVSRGARTIFFPKADAATTIVNKVDTLAGGAGNGSIVGAPTYSAGYANLKSLSNYISTGSADSATSTLLFVARTSDAGTANATTPTLGGNFTLGASGYMAYLGDSSGQLTFAGRRCTSVTGTPTNTSIVRVNVTSNTWAFLAMVYDDTAKTMTAYNKTTGITSSPLTYLGTHIAGASNVRIGSINSTYSGDADIAFAAEHNVALSSVEIDTIYQAIKSKLGAYATPITI